MTLDARTRCETDACGCIRLKDNLSVTAGVHAHVRGQLFVHARHILDADLDHALRTVRHLLLQGRSGVSQRAAATAVMLSAGKAGAAWCLAQVFLRHLCELCSDQVEGGGSQVSGLLGRAMCAQRQRSGKANSG